MSSIALFEKLFPLKFIASYIFNNIDNEIKAIFCKLILNIYIDKHPRNKIMKPNLVKIIKNFQSVENNLLKENQKYEKKVENFNHKIYILNLFITNL